jgi:hypothetical protein
VTHGEGCEAPIEAGEGYARHGKTHPTDDRSRARRGSTERLDRPSDRRSAPLEQRAPGVGERETARRAKEERHPEASLKLTHHLAHRRRGYRQFLGRATKAPDPCDDHEDMQGVERRVDHREVLLTTACGIERLPGDGARA